MQRELVIEFQQKSKREQNVFLSLKCFKYKEGKLFLRILERSTNILLVLLLGS